MEDHKLKLIPGALAWILNSHTKEIPIHVVAITMSKEHFRNTMGICGPRHVYSCHIAAAAVFLGFPTFGSQFSPLNEWVDGTYGSA